MENKMIRNQRYTQIKLAVAKKLRLEMTPAETYFWKAVKGNKLNGLHFRRQQVVNGFIADFYCDKLKLVVEIDGGVHEKQKDYDAERDRIIETLNIKVLRFTNQEVLKDIKRGVLYRRFFRNQLKMRLESTCLRS